MNRTFYRLSTAAILAAACALPLGAAAQSKSKSPAPAAASAAQGSSGKNSDAKHALAVKLAQIQQKTEGDSIAQQLTANAVQPLVVHWSQQLDQSMPPEQQKDVRAKLDEELKKFSEGAFKTIREQTAKTAESALVPLFMEKFSESELKAIIAYQESTAAAKFADIGNDAANAWATQVVEGTRGAIEASGKAFDDAAAKIVAAPPPPAAPASSASSAGADKK